MKIANSTKKQKQKKTKKTKKKIQHVTLLRNREGLFAVRVTSSLISWVKFADKIFWNYILYVT